MFKQFCFLFYSLSAFRSFLLALPHWLEFPIIMLSRSDESRHSCLAPEIRGKELVLSPLSVASAIGLLQTFYTTLKFTYSPIYTKSFYQEFFSNTFCGIYWDDHIVLPCYSVNIVNYVDWFSNVKPTLHFWNEPNLVMMYNLFIYCWFIFAKVLWGMFMLMFIKILSCRAVVFYFLFLFFFLLFYFYNDFSWCWCLGNVVLVG